MKVDFCRSRIIGSVDCYLVQINSRPRVRFFIYSQAILSYSLKIYYSEARFEIESVLTVTFCEKETL